MKQIVFYSWQSDLPNPCNRGFIQDALERAAATITADDSLEIEPVIDRDTQGVPGAPDIASTIFAKITSADVFVADVSITGRGEKRAMPNPNVLIELGYAIKALGHERVILVFNRAFGKIEELPFDLRARRVLSYDMPLEEKQRSTERQKLEGLCEEAIRAALPKAHVRTDPVLPAISAIEEKRPNRIVLLRRDLQAIFRKLEEYQPKQLSQGGTVDELIAALDKTQEPVAEFSKITEITAAMDDAESATTIQQWFGNLFEKYDLPQNFSGQYSDADHDYFKFLGHELYVTFVAFFILERRWDTLGKILAEPIPMRYLRREHGPANVEWEFASEHLLLLIDESARKRRMSLHADILNERHTRGGLATIMPMDKFMEADYFLWLFGELPPDQSSGSFFEWRPWSALYLKQTPLFLKGAEYKSTATQLTKFFRVPSIEEFKQRLATRGSRLDQLFRNGFWDNPLRTKDIERIGTR